VDHDALGREARRQRHVQLAARCHVTPQPLAREQREHRAAGERLRGEHHVEVLVSGVAAGPHERPRARAQVVLGYHVRRRAELPGQLERVAATHLEVAELVEPAAEGEHCGEARTGDHGR
jgi:hypothetical protein